MMDATSADQLHETLSEYLNVPTLSDAGTARNRHLPILPDDSVRDGMGGMRSPRQARGDLHFPLRTMRQANRRTASEALYSAHEMGSSPGRDGDLPAMHFQRAIQFAMPQPGRESKRRQRDSDHLRDGARCSLLPARGEKDNLLWTARMRRISESSGRIMKPDYLLEAREPTPTIQGVYDQLRFHGLDRGALVRTEEPDKAAALMIFLIWNKALREVGPKLVEFAEQNRNEDESQIMGVTLLSEIPCILEEMHRREITWSWVGIKQRRLTVFMVIGTEHCRKLAPILNAHGVTVNLERISEIWPECSQCFKPHNPAMGCLGRPQV